MGRADTHSLNGADCAQNCAQPSRFGRVAPADLGVRRPVFGERNTFFAKVRVAGSNPVVRSERKPLLTQGFPAFSGQVGEGEVAHHCSRLAHHSRRLDRLGNDWINQTTSLGFLGVAGIRR